MCCVSCDALIVFYETWGDEALGTLLKQNENNTGEQQSKAGSKRKKTTSCTLLAEEQPQETKKGSKENKTDTQVYHSCWIHWTYIADTKWIIVQNDLISCIPDGPTHKNYHFMKNNT